MKALMITLIFLSSAYREPSLTRHEVRTIGSSSGAVCASLYAHAETHNRDRQNRPYLGRKACFDTRRQCERWFFAAQTYFQDVNIRRPCR
ncbi:MAG: hypothetical protein AAFO61_12540 [Pseudomonadota bacterium]